MKSLKKSKAKTRDATKTEPTKANGADNTPALGSRRRASSKSEKPRAVPDQAQCGEASGKRADDDASATSRRDQQAELVFNLKTDRSRDRLRGHRPLAQLAAKEAELSETSTARAHLLAVDHKAVDPTLLAFQISASVNTQHTSRHLAKQMQSDARRLYAALESGDPVESIIDRLLVASTNAALSCYQRAAGPETKVRQVELRSAMQGTGVVGNLIKLRDGRRGTGHQNVTVGSLKVESGGQAIVGNVNAKKTEDEG